jgi:hypothetical protein
VEEFKLNTKHLIAVTFILSVASSAYAQQSNTASAPIVNRKVDVQVFESNDAISPKDITPGGVGNEVMSSTGPSPYQRKLKTRGEILAELQQAEANGTAMPTSFVAYDDGTHIAKYNITTQANSSK